MENAYKCRSRFTRPVFLWGATAFLIEVAVQWCYRRGWRVPLSVGLLPLLPMAFFIVALARTVQKMDEMQKRICLESALIAFLLTLALTFVFAGLDRAGVYRATWEDVGTPMLFLWGCAYLFSSWRYR
jgi:hypothetical protein